MVSQLTCQTEHTTLKTFHQGTLYFEVVAFWSFVIHSHALRLEKTQLLACIRVCWSIARRGDPMEDTGIVP